MILVTGGTGFVGGHLVDRLVQEKVQSRCLVRKGSNIEKLKKENALIDVAFGDLTDGDSLKKALKGVDAVVHLIGIIVEKKGATFEIIHSQGTRNLVYTVFQQNSIDCNGAKHLKYFCRLPINFQPHTIRCARVSHPGDSLIYGRVAS